MHNSGAGAPMLPFSGLLSWALRRLQVANAVRSATIVLMGATVVAAGVVVVLYG